MNKRQLRKLEEMVRERAQYHNPLVDLLVELSRCTDTECSHDSLRTLSTSEILRLTEETIKKYAV